MLSSYSDLFLSYMQNTELSDVGRDLRLHFTTEKGAVVTKDLSSPDTLGGNLAPPPLSQQLKLLP